MELRFSGEVFEWRGPAPYHFVAVPHEDSADLKVAARAIAYWGQVPVVATVGGTTFRTAMWPKDGRFLLPLKDAVRRAEGIELGEVVEVSLALAPR